MSKITRRQQKARERKVAIRAKERRKWKSRKNHIKNSKPQNKRRRLRNRNPHSQNVGRNTIVIPSVFSLVSNHEEVLIFFNKCKSINTNRQKNIFFDFSSVIDICIGSITILLSIIGWLKDHGVYVSGGYPKDEKARAFFERSGFLVYFKTQDPGKKIDSNNTILQRGQDRIQAKESAKQIHAAMKTVWGEDYRNPKIQGMLIELMANTVNHAYVNKKHQKGWYFSVDHIESENKVRFCFVDNGKGILSTIRMKFKEQFLNFITNKRETEILGKAFDGQFGSRTRLTNRGRGLPVIKKMVEEGEIKNLRVISNNVLLDFATNEASLLQEGFSGTFYYWELDRNCRLWKLK